MVVFMGFVCNKYRFCDTIYSVNNTKDNYLWFQYNALKKQQNMFRVVDFKELRKQEFYRLLNKKLRGC